MRRIKVNGARLLEGEEMKGVTRAFKPFDIFGGLEALPKCSQFQ